MTKSQSQSVRGGGSSENVESVAISKDPLRVQGPLGSLVREPITQTDDFYICSHGNIPRVDVENYRLVVEGMVQRPLRLRYRDLFALLAETEVEATLQCAGNRSQELDAISPIAKEAGRWGAAAIGTATWRGIALKRLLDAAGVLDGAQHVAFYGLDLCPHREQTHNFAGSIPIAKASDENVLLASQMNGSELTREHGYPLRAIVPGYIGARSVKWLHRIEVRGDSCDSPFQKASYKLIAKKNPSPEDWQNAPELGELSINSAIGSPVDGAEIVAGNIVVRGWSMAGGQRSVARVELSTDHGRSWQEATLHPTSTGCWNLWEAEIVLEPGSHELICRAWDSAANVQPEDPSQVWNVNGYMNHSWHRVRIWAE